jgi:hypothetical protein
MQVTPSPLHHTVHSIKSSNITYEAECHVIVFAIYNSIPNPCHGLRKLSQFSEEAKYQGMCLMTWLAWPRRGKLWNPVLCPVLEFDADHIVNSFTRKLVDREAIDFVLNNAVCRMHGCILMHKAAKAETLFGRRRKRTMPPRTVNALHMCGASNWNNSIPDGNRALKPANPTGTHLKWGGFDKKLDPSDLMGRVWGGKPAPANPL